MTNHIFRFYLILIDYHMISHWSAIYKT